MAFPVNQHISELAEIVFHKGIRYAVISPGSRNAPLITSFLHHGKINCLSIVDERSAAFFALGIARQQGKPVALISTSGTAVLNYAPALAEAYYQQVPLLVLTADRPVEWIDQQDNQTIRQQAIYTNYIKNSFQLPQEVHSETDIWHSQRLISEAVNLAGTFPEGPVHVNVPLKEPLYSREVAENPRPKIINLNDRDISLNDSDLKGIAGKWNNSARKLIICGQQNKNEELNRLLSQFAEDNSVTVIAENLSNLTDEHFIDCPDKILTGASQEELLALTPDILISFGGPVVSKRLKLFLRNHKPQEHWLIDPSMRHIDTYQSLTHILPIKPLTFFRQIMSLHKAIPAANYHPEWKTLKTRVELNHNRFLADIPFSDLQAFQILLEKIPVHSVLQLGNSSPVRYAQFFKTSNSLSYYSNRGTSGIDGCLSTAAGSAYFNNKTLTTVILGDLSFMYDSNALWNKNLTDNLRIVVLNNGGGGIFRLIDGPSGNEGFEEFFETRHPVNIELLTQAFNLTYYYCDNAKDLNAVLDKFFDPIQNAAVLEIKTPRKENAVIYKNYLNYIKKSDGTE